MLISFNAGAIVAALPWHQVRQAAGRQFGPVPPVDPVQGQCDPRHGLPATIAEESEK